MAKIPNNLHDHINGAYPDNTVMVCSVLPNGFAQFTLRGSVYVYDDEHLAWWERGFGTTNDNLDDGSKLTVVYRNMDLRSSLLPKGGVSRFYGTAKLIKDGLLRDQIYDGIIKHEQSRDAEKKGIGVIFKVDRAEHFDGSPLSE